MQDLVSNAGTRRSISSRISRTTASDLPADRRLIQDYRFLLFVRHRCGDFAIFAKSATPSQESRRSRSHRLLHRLITAAPIQGSLGAIAAVFVSFPIEGTAANGSHRHGPSGDGERDGDPWRPRAARWWPHIFQVLLVSFTRLAFCGQAMGLALNGLVPDGPYQYPW